MYVEVIQSGNLREKNKATLNNAPSFTALQLQSFSFLKYGQRTVVQYKNIDLQLNELTI
jgi:hypothetical protein